MDASWHTIRVLIVDDDPAMREHFRSLLQFESDVVTVGMARSGKEASQLAFDLEVDVALVGLPLPDVDSPDSLTIISSGAPEMALIITLPEGASFFPTAPLSHTVKAILTKPSATDIVVDAIRQANRSREFKRRVYGQALAIAQELNLELDLVHQAIYRLRRSGLVETYLNEENRLWAAITPKGEMVLSQPHPLETGSSTREYNVLQAMYRLFDQPD